MLQRIQSVYLFLAMVLAVLFLLFPLGTFKSEDITVHIILSNNLSGLGNIPDAYSSLYHIGLLVISIGAVIFTGYLILQYKRRPHQVMLGKVNIMIHLLMLVISFFYLDEVKSVLTNMSYSYGPAIFFPLVSLLLIMRANRSILKDEKMVRAADRIR